MADKHKEWADLKGQRCELMRKGEKDVEPGVVSEVTGEFVTFIFDTGGVLYVPHDDIQILEAEREAPVKRKTKADEADAADKGE